MNAPVAQENLQRELKQYTGVALRVMKLLIAGCKQEQAAKAVGVSPSLVSQLCAEEDFQIQLAQHVKVGIERSLTIDETWDKIEETLVQKLHAMLPLLVNVDQVTRILKLVNSAERKTQQGKPMQQDSSEPGAAGGTVKLILPVIIKNTYVVNPQNEVIGVDGRNMVTLNSESINTLAGEYIKEKELQKVENTTNLKLENKADNNGYDRSGKEDKWSNL